MKIISRKTGIIFILIGLCAPIVTLLLSDYGDHHNIFKAKIILLDKIEPLLTEEEIEERRREREKLSEEEIKKIFEGISKEISEKKYKKTSEEELKKSGKGKLVSISDRYPTKRILIEISYRYILAFCIILVFVGIGILVYTPMGIMRNRNE